MDTDTSTKSVFIPKLTFNVKQHIFCGVYRTATYNKQRSAGIISMIITVDSVKANGVTSDHRNESLSVFGMRALTDGEDFLSSVKPGGLIPHSSLDQSSTGEGYIVTFLCCDGR